MKANNGNIDAYIATEKPMPASDKFTPTKHRMKGKGFVVFNKCPYCEIIHPTIEQTPLPKHMRYWPQACPDCKINRHKSEDGEGYTPTGRKKSRVVNG